MASLRDAPSNVDTNKTLGARRLSETPPQTKILTFKITLCILHVAFRRNAMLLLYSNIFFCFMNFGISEKRHAPNPNYQSQ